MEFHVIWRTELYNLLEGKYNYKIEYLGSATAWVDNVVASHDSILLSRKAFTDVLEEYIMSPLSAIYKAISAEQVYYAVELVREHLYDNINVIANLYKNVLLPLYEDLIIDESLIRRLKINIESVMSDGIISIGKYFDFPNIGNNNHNRRLIPFFDTFCIFLTNIIINFSEKCLYFTAGISCNYLLQYEKLDEFGQIKLSTDFKKYIDEHVIKYNKNSYSELTRTYIASYNITDLNFLKILVDSEKNCKEAKESLPTWQQILVESNN